MPSCDLQRAPVEQLLELDWQAALPLGLQTWMRECMNCHRLLVWSCRRAPHAAGQEVDVQRVQEPGSRLACRYHLLWGCVLGAKPWMRRTAPGEVPLG